MKLRVLAVACALLVSAGTTPVRAEGEARDITRRIQALRERLEKIRSSAPKNTAETTSSQVTPGSPASQEAGQSGDEVEAHSDAIEHRQGVQVMILFHDGAGSAAASTGQGSPAAPAPVPAAGPTEVTGAPQAPAGGTVPEGLAGSSPRGGVAPVSAPSGLEVSKTGTAPATPPNKDTLKEEARKTLRKTAIEALRRKYAFQPHIIEDYHIR